MLSRLQRKKDICCGRSYPKTQKVTPVAIEADQVLFAIEQQVCSQQRAKRSLTMSSLPFATAPSVVRTAGRRKFGAVAGTCRVTSDSSARRMVRTYVASCQALHRVPLCVRDSIHLQARHHLRRLRPFLIFGPGFSTGQGGGSFQNAVAKIRVCGR